MRILDEIFQGRRGRGMRGFPTRHAGLDDLDTPVRDALRKYIPSREKIKHVITAPSQWVAWKATPDHYLVMTDKRVLVAAINQSEAEPNLSVIQLMDILSMELGKILLYAWLDWSWVEGQETKQVRVYFNPVGEKIFHQVVMDICRRRIQQSGLKSTASQRNLSLLDDLPYKFKNIIAGSLLLPDEVVQTILFREAIMDHQLLVIRRTLSPAMALIVTNFHVLIMREDVGYAGSKYGVIFRYFPLDSVQQAELREEENLVYVYLTLQRHGMKEKIELLFREVHAPRLTSMISRWIKT